MPRTITAVIVTNDESMADRIRGLTSGSQVAVLGHTAYTPRGVRKILKNPPHLVLCDGSAGEGLYAPYARNISPPKSRSLVVLLSSQADVAVLARAAVAGVSAVIPPLLPQTQLVDSLTKIAEGAAPDSGTAFERIREELGIPFGKTSQAPSLDRRSDQRDLAERCLRLGLSEAETATFLRVDVADIRRLEPTTDSRLKMPTLSGISTGWRRLLCSAFVAVLGLGYLAAFDSPPASGPFRGRIAYEDASPIPAGALRVEFWPIRDTAGRGIVAYATTDNVTGVFTTVTNHSSNASSLSPGLYRVTLRQGTGDLVPSSIIPEEYGDPSRSPLTCDPSKGATLFAVRDPSISVMLTHVDDTEDAKKQDSDEPPPH